MELFDGVSPVETWIVNKADALKRPIGGSMELLPLCNMSCKMCYIRQTEEEMKAQGRMLTCDEWLRIAESAKEAGVLFLLLTGGEPLMYPDFRRLYTALSEMGFVITINTNGTLIDEQWADLFAQRPCRRMNITLYGKDDATYADLCRNPKGYTQVLRAVELLKERNVPFRFNFTCTPYNLDQLPQLYDFARKINVPMAFSNYVFPPTRKGGTADDIVRLSPERCGEALVIGTHAKNPNYPMELNAKASLNRLMQPVRNYAAGYHCRAGHSGFWINWKGELLPCGMFQEPKISLLEHTFTEAWNEVSVKFRANSFCQDCEKCKKRNICSVCLAACYTETGSTLGKPQYLCDATDEKIRLFLTYLTREEQMKFLEKI